MPALNPLAGAGKGIMDKMPAIKDLAWDAERRWEMSEELRLTQWSSKSG
jgi:hypothetical protein